MRAHSYTLKCILYYRLNRRRCCAYQLNYASLGAGESIQGSQVGRLYRNWAARRASAIFDLVDGRGIYEDRKEKGGDS